MGPSIKYITLEDAFSHPLENGPEPPTDYSLENALGFDVALVNKLVPCAWLLSGALEVWSLRLRLRLRMTTKQCEERYALIQIQRKGLSYGDQISLVPFRDGIWTFPSDISRASPDTTLPAHFPRTIPRIVALAR